MSLNKCLEYINIKTFSELKALQLVEPGNVDIVEVDRPVAQTGEVLIKMKAAALNRRDQWIREGKYPNIQTNITLGSDGSGEVIEAGSSDVEKWVGKKVIINPNVKWGSSSKAQSSEYSVLGMPVDGTLAEYMAVDAARIAPQPEHLNAVEAAALPLGGLTAYRAIMKQDNLQPNDKVLISGFGGGVAQFAFQFGVAAGAEVYVTSSSAEKIQSAVDMGAKMGFNYKEESWPKKAITYSKGFDVVIDSAGGDQINTFIKMMRPGGKIVFYGATNGLPAKLDMYRMFWNQLTLQGTTMGSDGEFTEMLKFVSKHKIKPIVDKDVRLFSEVKQSLDQMREGDRIGKLVVRFF